FIYGIVNDVVVAQIHVVAFGRLTSLGVSTHVKADDDGLGSQRQVDVGLGDTTHARVHDLYLDFVGRQLEQRCCQRFLRALYVGLDDQRQSLHVARSHVREHVLQLGSLLLGQLGVTELACTVS